MPSPDPSGPGRVCVFCGSRSGLRPAYAELARSTGRVLAEAGVGVVFGGGRVGLMGELADGALAAGGEVIGVIPRSLVAREVAHEGLTALVVVDTMHERKQRMSELSDAFVALPGGLGTFDELCEILTWGQLGIHAKPVCLLDVADYFAPLRAALDQAVEEGFLDARQRASLLDVERPEQLLARLARR